jgi:hypothetical protein
LTSPRNVSRSLRDGPCRFLVVGLDALGGSRTLPFSDDVIGGEAGRRCVRARRTSSPAATAGDAPCGRDRPAGPGWSAPNAKRRGPQRVLASAYANSDSRNRMLCRPLPARPRGFEPLTFVRRIVRHHVAGRRSSRRPSGRHGSGAWGHGLHTNRPSNTRDERASGQRRELSRHDFVVLGQPRVRSRGGGVDRPETSSSAGAGERSRSRPAQRRGVSRR